MDSKPFVAWGLFCSANTMPKEENEVGEESDLSLELSLSCGYMSSLTDEGKEGIYYKESSEVGEINNTDQYQRKENKMEMKVEGFSLELSDISLELSLSGDYSNYMARGKSPKTDKGKQERLEEGECGNQYQREDHNNVNNRQEPKVEGFSLELSLGFNETRTSKKRGRMENSSSTRKVSSRGNKRLKVEREEKSEVVSTELRLGHDPWCIKKQLTGSDLSNMARLLLASELVESHILPFWNADQRAKIKEGLAVSVYDCDTYTAHAMVFKQWNKGANVLIKNWVKDFVKRRELKVGDEIGLYWDSFSSRFNFSVLNPVARH